MIRALEAEKDGNQDETPEDAEQEIYFQARTIDPQEAACEIAKRIPE